MKNVRFSGKLPTQRKLWWWWWHWNLKIDLWLKACKINFIKLITSFKSMLKIMFNSLRVFAVIIGQKFEHGNAYFKRTNRTKLYPFSDLSWETPKNMFVCFFLKLYSKMYKKNCIKIPRCVRFKLFNHLC